MDHDGGLDALAAGVALAEETTEFVALEPAVDLGLGEAHGLHVEDASARVQGMPPKSMSSSGSER